MASEGDATLIVQTHAEKLREEQSKQNDEAVISKVTFTFNTVYFFMEDLYNNQLLYQIII